MEVLYDEVGVVLDDLCLRGPPASSESTSVTRMRVPRTTVHNVRVDNDATDEPPVREFCDKDKQVMGQGESGASPHVSSHSSQASGAQSSVVAWVTCTTQSWHALVLVQLPTRRPLRQSTAARLFSDLITQEFADDIASRVEHSVDSHGVGVLCVYQEIREPSG